MLFPSEILYINKLIEKYGVDILKETINLAYFYEEKVSNIDFVPILKKYNLMKENSKAKILVSYYKGYSGNKVDLNIKNGRNQYIYGFTFDKIEIPKTLQYLNTVEKEGDI